jgi:hypothetical protein
VREFDTVFVALAGARDFDVVPAGFAPLAAETVPDAGVFAPEVALAGAFGVVVATVERVAALRAAVRVRSLPGDVTVCPL